MRQAAQRETTDMIVDLNGSEVVIRFTVPEWIGDLVDQHESFIEETFANIIADDDAISEYDFHSNEVTFTFDLYPEAEFEHAATLEALQKGLIDAVLILARLP